MNPIIQTRVTSVYVVKRSKEWLDILMIGLMVLYKLQMILGEKENNTDLFYCLLKHLSVTRERKRNLNIYSIKIHNEISIQILRNLNDTKLLPLQSLRSPHILMIYLFAENHATKAI